MQAETTETEEENGEKPEQAEQGMPALHGMTGEEFGAAVSALAQSSPGAVADHVRKNPEQNMPEDTEDPENIEDPDEGEPAGLPAVHGMTGTEFGAAVSGLAESDPAALVAHVRKR